MNNNSSNEAHRGPHTTKYERLEKKVNNQLSLRRRQQEISSKLSSQTTRMIVLHTTKVLLFL